MTVEVLPSNRAASYPDPLHRGRLILIGAKRRFWLRKRTSLPSATYDHMFKIVQEGARVLCLPDMQSWAWGDEGKHYFEDLGDAALYTATFGVFP